MSGSRGGVSVVVSATDRATKTIDAINRKLDAMQRPTRALQRQLTKFGELSGLTKLGQGFQGLARAGIRSAEAIAKIAAPLASLTGALSLAGLARLVTNFAEFGSQLGFTGQRLGMMPGQLQALQGAAEFAGTSAQGLTNGIGALGQTMVDAIAGRATDAVLMMTSLGISMRGSAGEARTAADVLPELADKIARLRNPFLQARAAAAFFGGAAEDMLPFLRSGSQGIKEYTDMAAKYGTMSDEDVKRANDLRMAQVALKLSVAGLTNEMGSSLAPVLGPLLLQLAELIRVNKDAISSKITEMVKMLGDAIKAVNWVSIVADVKHFAVGVDGLAQSFGGWKTVLEGIIALRFGGFLLSLVGGLNPVTLAVLSLTAAYLANSAAYDQFIQRRKRGKEADRESIALQDRFNALTPAKQLEFNAAQRRNGLPELTPGAVRPPMPQTDLDRQRRAAGLPGRIGGAGQDAMAQSVIGMLVGMGRDPATAAAMAANMARESGFNPRAVGDGGAAAGIGQWHPDRQARIAQHFGKSLEQMDLAEQVSAYDWELRTFGPKGLQSTAGAGQKAALISTGFERPADRDGEAAARSLLANHFAGFASPVSIGDGSGASPVALAGTVKGSATMNINLRGAPPGTTTTSSANGDFFSAPPRVNLAMAGVGP